MKGNKVVYMGISVRTTMERKSALSFAGNCLLLTAIATTRYTDSQL